MKEAVIVAGARTPVGKAKKGTLKDMRPDDLGALVVKETIERAGNYDENIDDLIIGCAMPEAEQGMNVAEILEHWQDYHIQYRRLRLIAIVHQVFKRLPMQQKKLH